MYYQHPRYLKGKREMSEATKTMLTIIVCICLLFIVGWRQSVDEEESEAAFYAACHPSEGQRVIVENHAGFVSCPQRFEIMKYGEARK